MGYGLLRSSAAAPNLQSSSRAFSLRSAIAPTHPSGEGIGRKRRLYDCVSPSLGESFSAKYAHRVNGGGFSVGRGVGCERNLQSILTADSFWASAELSAPSVVAVSRPNLRGGVTL